MIVLGLDIGTTTISAVVMENGKLLATKTRKNDSFITGCPSWERAQDPARILACVRAILEELTLAYPKAERIGLTGQQHGIVYLDAAGRALSPLYTWQDGRGDLPYRDGLTYCGYLTEQTGYPLATGYGMVTHFYNLKNGLVPESAVTFCTIQDYVALNLTQDEVRPALDASDAASFGLFDVEKGCFDQDAVQSAGIKPGFLPALAKSACLGVDEKGRQVYVAIGDNQASFLGATGGQTACMLVNIGTGSQLSIHVDGYMRCEGLETRPFPMGGYLLVGAALCGGKAYALLEGFFRQIVQMVTGQSVASCYDAMERLLEQSPEPSDYAKVTPLFRGTRSDASLRASIGNLSEENFQPLSLMYGMMRGMAQELYDMLACFMRTGGTKTRLFGSGNGLRLNKRLCAIVENTFQMPLRLSQNQEEAACGAAYFASRQ